MTDERSPKPGEVWMHPKHGLAVALQYATYLRSAKNHWIIGDHLWADGWRPCIVAPEPEPIGRGDWVTFSDEGRERLVTGVGFGRIATYRPSTDPTGIGSTFWCLADDLTRCEPPENAAEIEAMFGLEASE